MRRISLAVEEATTCAALAQIKAIRAPTLELRAEHERIAKGWQDLAEGFREAEKISGFLAWAAERVPAP